MAGQTEGSENPWNGKFMSVPFRQKNTSHSVISGLFSPVMKSTTDYYREFNISKAICLTSYKVGETTFTREYFASYPDNIIAINLTADKKRSLTFDVALTAEHEGFCD